MSKMSQLAMELDEQAVELGFKDREDAMANGYEVISDGAFARLVKTETEQEEAHKVWLEQREKLLEKLAKLKVALGVKVEHTHIDGKDDWEIIEDAVDFILKGEM